MARGTAHPFVCGLYVVDCLFLVHLSEWLALPLAVAIMSIPYWKLWTKASHKKREE